MLLTDRPAKNAGQSAAEVRAPRTLRFPADRSSLAAGALIVAYFLLLTYRGLATYFTNDDVTNIAFLHGVGQIPIGVLLMEALIVVTPAYRPVGGLYYRILYAVFGLNPVAFRVAFFALLLLNLGLAARWCRQLGISRLGVALAALLLCYNPVMPEIYYSGSYVYDVLCGFFLLLALGAYARTRSRGELLSTRSLLVVAALYGAALGSKEMALAFPGILLAYEAIFHPRWQRWRQRLQPILLLAAMTALCLALKIMVPNPMSTNVLHQYTPTLEPAHVGRCYLRYYQLLAGDDRLTAGALLLVLLGTLAVAVILRQRAMLFGWIFANLTLFPVCVVAQRTGAIWYIPLLGWAIYAGSATSLVVEGLLARVSLRRPARAIAFGVAVITLYAVHVKRSAHLGGDLIAQGNALASLVRAARAESPVLPPYSRVLVEGDPLPDLAWGPLFVLRLGYRDSTLWVDRVAHTADAANRDLGIYALRMKWDGAGYRVIAQRPSRAGEARVSFMPEIVHRGQSIEMQWTPGSHGGCPVDVAYNMPEDELMRAGVWLQWVKLDDHGRGMARVNPDAERGVIRIDHVRACGGEWEPAQGTFVVIP